MFKHCFKTVLALSAMLLSLTAFAAGENEAKPNVSISDGSRLQLKGKGFSIVPPKGWEVHSDVPGVSFLFQVPNSNGLKYQRNITVRYAQGEKTIDEYTADEYQDLIVENRSKIYGNMKNYRMRNRAEVELADGNKGLLFYAEFDFEELPMMEMHLLVSSNRGHFLMSYTDLAEHFNPDSNTPYLQEAYNSLISAKVDQPAGARFGFMAKWGVVIALLVFGLFGLRWLSSSFIKRQMTQEHGEFMSDDTVESGVSAISGTSAVDVSDSPRSIRSAKKTRLENDDDMDYMPVSAEAVEEDEADMGLSGISWQKTRSTARKLKKKTPAIPKKRAVNQDFDDSDDDLDFEADD